MSPTLLFVLMFFLSIIYLLGTSELVYMFIMHLFVYPACVIFCLSFSSPPLDCYRNRAIDAFRSQSNKTCPRKYTLKPTHILIAIDETGLSGN